jgi:hypothetical protein
MDRYSRDFVCTYKHVGDADAGTDHADEEEAGDLLYQAQLLQAFGLDSYSDDLDEYMNVLYRDLERVHPDQLNDVISALKVAPKLGFLRDVFMLGCKTSCAENLILFRFLFQFAYFDLFHRCMVTEWQDKAAIAALLDMIGQ